jgi:hypothetical protein
MDYSRDRRNSVLQGGAKDLYIMPYVDYLDSEITVENNILTVFPKSTIYRVVAENINISIDAKQDKDIEYSEKISFQLKKLSEKDKFKEYLKQDYRIIIKDNNGKIRLFGLQNGLICSYKEESGTNRNEFSGYSFNFEGKEENSAPYLNDLSLFVVSGMFQFSTQYEL